MAVAVWEKKENRGGHGWEKRVLKEIVKKKLKGSPRGGDRKKGVVKKYLKPVEMSQCQRGPTVLEGKLENRKDFGRLGIVKAQKRGLFQPDGE